MINLSVPQTQDEATRPRIAVVGVGGAGGNALNNMIADNLQGVEFVAANTDAQALTTMRTDNRIQLGATITQGLGAGAQPEVGAAAAEEASDDIAQSFEGANMVFITAGMGGGTGTGAVPVVARIARDLNILTVGVVTKPFQFEGVKRMALAESGIDKLSQFVDTLIVIPNQNLFRVANEKTTFADAFKMADDVLNQGVRSITDLMIMPGLINLDFADVRTVMSNMGRAMMGSGEASGDRRALDAAEAAIANPLLEDTCMKGAQGVLINITGGPDITLFEVDEAANRVRDEIESEANIIFGSCFDPDMESQMRVAVVATGISATEQQAEDEDVPVVAKTATETAMPIVDALVKGSAVPPQMPPIAAGASLAFSQTQATDRALDQATPPLPAKPEQPTQELSQPSSAREVNASAWRQRSAETQTLQALRALASAASSRDRDVVANDSSTPSAAVAAAATRPIPSPATANVQVRSAARPSSLLSRLARLGQRDGSPPVSATCGRQGQVSSASAGLVVDPTDRSDMKSKDEAELEIPSFLRRQAN